MTHAGAARGRVSQIAAENASVIKQKKIVSPAIGSVIGTGTVAGGIGAYELLKGGK